MIHEWVRPLLIVLACLIVGLTGLRIATFRSGNRAGGLAYLVVATLVVGALAVAGVVWWRKMASEAMAPEK